MGSAKSQEVQRAAKQPESRAQNSPGTAEPSLRFDAPNALKVFAWLGLRSPRKGNPQMRINHRLRYSKNSSVQITAKTQAP